MLPLNVVLAVAMFVIDETVMSAAWIVYVPVHVLVAEGERLVGHVTVAILLSVIVNGPGSVTLPVFVITYVYVITWPTAL